MLPCMLSSLHAIAYILNRENIIVIVENSHAEILRSELKNQLRFVGENNYVEFIDTHITNVSSISTDSLGGNITFSRVYCNDVKGSGA